VPKDAVAQDAAIPAFMEPPAFADLKMPVLDASADLAAQAELPLPAGLPVFMDARRRTGPPAARPDHAVPWGLAGTPANWAPLDPPSAPGSSSQATTRPAGSPAMRPGTRRRVLAAAMAAVVLAVAGAVGWSAYTRSRTVTASQPQPPAQSPAAPALPVHQARRASSGPHHAGQKTTGPGAGTGATTTSKTHPAPGGTPSPKHSSPAKPHSTPTATPSPVATGSGSPGPGSGGGPPPPPGYQWFQVSAASLGTTAGFRIAVPDAWRMSRNGLVTYLDPAAGKPYITVDVTPFAYPGPVREAMYQQAQAKAGHLYPVYRLVAIRPAGFRGVPEAIWRFHWQEPGVGQIGVLEVFFTLTTSAGKQSYALTVSAPEARFIAVRAIFHQALQTFAPLP
jgi:hypothetical protein